MDTLMEKETEEMFIASKKLAEWTVDEVGVFLSSISLPQYRDVFYFNRIDGEMLSIVDNEDLLVLPIERTLHRKKILRKVARILRDSNSDDNLSESIPSDSPQGKYEAASPIRLPFDSRSLTGSWSGMHDTVSRQPTWNGKEEDLLKRDVLTLEETARYMRLQPREIRSFIKIKGGRGLRAVKTSGGYRIHKKAIEKFMLQE